MKKKSILTIITCSLLLLVSTRRGQAQIPVVNVFTSVVKKVIVAIDLQVQRLQNKTIGLQNAAQKLENTLHLNSLNNISGWLNKEKDLYAGYYEELSKVRSLIAGFTEVKQIVVRQQQIVAEYRQASGLFSRDPHFTPTELRYISDLQRHPATKPG